MDGLKYMLKKFNKPVHLMKRGREKNLKWTCLGHLKFLN